MALSIDIPMLKAIERPIIIRGMSTFGQRVKAAREQKGWSQETLAKAVGIKQPSVFSIENGPASGNKNALKIALVTGVRPEWLDTGDGPMVGEPRKVSVNRSSKGPVLERPSGATVSQGDDKLRVLGMAEGGPDGWSLWNGDIIEWIDRPANLRGVPDAYAVYISGSSMEPRYHPGELAHIHPHKPVTIGAYVLVQKLSKEPGEPPLAVIKRLAKRSGNRIVLEQFNPPRTFEIKADEIVSIHRVVGSGEG